MQGGFYPAPEEAVAFALRFLRPPADQPFSMLDPCAGEGAALRQLGEALSCPAARTFAIELDEGRAEQVRAALPEAHVLAPASCFGCRVSPNSFSFIWLNPPFDFAYRGHRVEDQFLRTATTWLRPGGVMAFVCPEDVVEEYSDARCHFATSYEHCQIVPFPEPHRRFHEVIVFGHKLARPHLDEETSEEAWQHVLAPEGFVYQIPPGTDPCVFQKTEPTEPELQRLLEASPLHTHLTVAPAAPLPSPPLALGIGHIALLLASGHLDGVVQPEGRPPHVVRGTSRKRPYVADVTDTPNSDGSTTTKTTISERIELMVRTVDLSGRIRTFLDNNGSEA
jgi:hypothetical protein